MSMCDHDGFIEAHMLWSVERTFSTRPLGGLFKYGFVYDWPRTEMFTDCDDTT